MTTDLFARFARPSTGRCARSGGRPRLGLEGSPCWLLGHLGSYRKTRVSKSKFGSRRKRTDKAMTEGMSE